MTPRIPTFPPPVSPIPTGCDRPMWSVMIPVFNCGRYVEEALRSVLMQDPGPGTMQISVVDDASTDIDVAALVNRVGDSRVELYRQPTNVGSLWNFSACLNKARGHYVHLLHGDDRVLNGYYAAIENLFSEYPQAGACISGVRYINEAGTPSPRPEPPEAPSAGILANWLQRIAIGPRIQYAALTVKRDVYEEVGGYFGVTYGEDWEMHARIASKYAIACTPDVLAEYRTHKDSISRNKIRLGQNLKDLSWVVRTIQDYLPSEQRASLRKQAEREVALYGLHYARQLWRFERDRAAAERQLRGAQLLCADEDIVRAAEEISARMLAESPA